MISKKEILIGVGHGCLFAADTIAESRRKGKFLKRLKGNFLQKKLALVRGYYGICNGSFRLRMKGRQRSQLRKSSLGQLDDHK